MAKKQILKTFRMDYTKSTTGYFEVKAKDKNQAMTLILAGHESVEENDIEDDIDYDKNSMEEIDFVVTPDDVKRVAKDIGVKITKKQIAQVIKEYQDAQDEDPNATWDLVVENQIYGL